MSEDALRLQQLVFENNKALRVSRGSPAWRSYLDSFNHMVTVGVQQCVSRLLIALEEMISATARGGSPILAVTLEFTRGTVRFKPTIEQSSTQSF